jgi:hypothetical protein
MTVLATTQSHVMVRHLGISVPLLVEAILKQSAPHMKALGLSSILLSGRAVGFLLQTTVVVAQVICKVQLSASQI